jgi:hypothetical protein
MNQGAPQTASANAAAPQPKPIRFVTNHDGPYAKRRRINSACLTCRKKKTRCSGRLSSTSRVLVADGRVGERPVCGTCIQNKHECAGYGDDNATTENQKDGKKAARRESSASNSAPSRKQEPPIDPHLTRPHLPHTTSHTSESSVHASPKVESTGSSGGLSLSTRNRMPYFRYFGPTAIVPGLRQMVVKVRGKQHGSAQTTSDRTYTLRATDLQLVIRSLKSICAQVASTRRVRLCLSQRQRSRLVPLCYNSVSCS